MSDKSRTTSLSTLSYIITTHETGQNYLKFTDIPNTEFDKIRALLESEYPGGTWISEVLYNTPVEFFTILTGFGPATVTATDHYHYRYNSQS